MNFKFLIKSNVIVGNGTVRNLHKIIKSYQQLIASKKFKPPNNLKKINVSRTKNNHIRFQITTEKKFSHKYKNYKLKQKCLEKKQIK